MTPFASNIRKARNFFGWSQQQVADLIGIARPTLGSYEEGRAEPPMGVIVAIADLYQVTDLRGFLSNRNFNIKNQGTKMRQKSVIDRRYARLRGSPKRAVDVLLGIR